MAIIQNLFIYRSKVEPENKSFIWARTVQVREKIEIELLIWDVDHWITLGDSSIIEEFRSYPWDTLTPDVPTPIEDGTDIFTAITSLHSLVKENVKNILTLENKQTSIDADIVMLNSRVDDVGNAILDVKDDITAINNDLSVINTDIINVNNRVNDTNTRIDETNNNVQNLDDKIVGLDENIQANLIELYNIKLNKAPLNDLPLLNDNGVIDNAYLPASQIAVTGVKGHQESNYRNGNVDLTIQNILGDLQGNEIESIGEELYTISTPNNVEYVTTYRKDTAGFTHLTQHPYSEFALKPDLLREFTFIVDSQDSFNLWANRQSGLDLTRVLIKAGTYDLNSEIDLGYYQYVKAMPGAIINYNVPTNSQGAFFISFGAAEPSRVDHIGKLYEGLIVNLSDRYDQTAFRNCSNLKDCGVHIRTTNPGAIYLSIGFYNCTNLYNCYLFAPVDTQYLSILGFTTCTNLNDCIVSNWYDETENTIFGFVGYSNCRYLNNCTCIFTGFLSNQTTDGNCFASCYFLRGCNGQCPVAPNIGIVDIFRECHYLSDCVASYGTQSGGWCYNRCRSMRSNSAAGERTYNLCYADAGTAYPVSDTPNGGFNS